MQYALMGNTGVRISRIIMGTYPFGVAPLAKGVDAVVGAALEVGINVFDTSNSYGGGLSEEYIGRALKGKRQQALIATKVASRAADGPNQSGASRQHILTEVENSLQALGTDYIDLYQIHFPDSNTPIEETLHTLDSLVQSGKVRYIGCSNFMAWQVCEAHWTSKSQGLTPFVSAQPKYSMLHRDAEAELVPFCQAYGVGILPYFPLANGFLTGKYRRGEPAPDGTRLAQNDRGMFTDAHFDLLEALESFASGRGHTVLELAFAWLLANSAVSSVIAGATKPEQVVANAKSAGWRLSSEELAEVDSLLGK